MPSWEEKVRQAKSGAFSSTDRQRGRVVFDLIENKERAKDVLRSYWLWFIGAVPVGVVIAKFFLDHSNGK